MLSLWLALTLDHEGQTNYQAAVAPSQQAFSEWLTSVLRPGFEIKAVERLCDLTYGEAVLFRLHNVLSRVPHHWNA